MISFPKSDSVDSSREFPFIDTENPKIFLNYILKIELIDGRVVVTHNDPSIEGSKYFHTFESDLSISAVQCVWEYIKHSIGSPSIGAPQNWTWSRVTEHVFRKQGLFIKRVQAIHDSVDVAIDDEESKREEEEAQRDRDLQEIAERAAEIVLRKLLESKSSYTQ